MKNLNLTVRAWRDYELLDSGDNRKLERYGKFVLIRPETQAIWRPSKPELWKQAMAEFQWNDGKGSWKKQKAMPESWEMQWNDARFTMRLTSFKHTGIFPEQAANWEWIAERVIRLAAKGIGRGADQEAQAPRVLNLFGYTGIASIVAAKSGAQVTHVDASKQSNLWAKDNATLSEIGAEISSNEQHGSIRYLLDDAMKFVEREARRGAVYDGIVLDPPAFGRGAKGEVWKIEEDIAKLLEELTQIFSKKTGAFLLLNGYAAGYSPQSFAQATEQVFPEMKKSTSAEFGELQIQESDSERVIPAGIYVRFIRS
jgi:23S rRNA (cytosine1962-C5)-methyltransferase